MDFKNKKLIISFVSFIFICLSFYLIYVHFKSKGNPTSNNLERETQNQNLQKNALNQQQDKKKDIIIKKICIETEHDWNSEAGREDIAKKISDYIKNKIGNIAFSHSSWLLDECKPSYNISMKYCVSDEDPLKRKNLLPCELIMPIKNPPEDLLAVFFDGGERKQNEKTVRGGDELPDAEGDYIAKYTLEDLTKFDKDVDYIYIFEKRKKPIKTIKVGSYEEMMSKIKEINPSVGLYNNADVEESEEVKKNIKAEYENNYKPGFNEFERNECNYIAGSQRKNFRPLLNIKLKNVDPKVMGVYIRGDATGELQTCIGYNNETVDITDVLRLTDKEYEIYIFEQE